MTEAEQPRAPHPAVWMILYIPFGALGGFITVALTFLATTKGLSISEGALLNGAQMLISWMKWLWAPIVDVTLNPRKWYVISTAASAVGIFTMAAIPLGPNTLPLLLAVIAAASLVNSVVGMSVEAIMSRVVTPDQAGRVGAWFQAGNLGGAGLGGALGLFLIQKLPAPWMSGAIMGALFVACTAALNLTPVLPGHKSELGFVKSVKSVVGDLRTMLKTKGGLLSAILCVLPVGTGAAQTTLTQAEVAAYWGAGPTEVEWLQGVLAGLLTAAGCFVGGYVCQRFQPRTAYAGIGIGLALIATGMAVTPATVITYIIWSLLYSFAVGLAYAAFTAVVLHAMGHGSGATKYNVFASASNFPIWWLGLTLGYAAQRFGARAMLLTEAGFGVLGVLVFAGAVSRVRRSLLPERAE
ncbi:MAG: MFS transporter [Polyangiaceae bacterium]